jgi:TIR domain
VGRVPQESSPENTPKIFPSYAWSDERTTMVREICDRLVQDGIRCLLDQWHVKEGDDVFHFIEMSVKDPTVTSVLIFCDALYASKVDSRTGGVGTESQILTPELYAKVENTRFIPIICEYDEQGKACQPSRSVLSQ